MPLGTFYLYPEFQVALLVLYTALLGAFVAAGYWRLKTKRQRKLDTPSIAILGTMALLNVFVFVTSVEATTDAIKLDTIEIQAGQAAQRGVNFDPDQDFELDVPLWFDTWWRSSYVQNIWVFDILFAITWLILIGASREYWRNAWRQVTHRKVAMVCFFILMGYVFIGLIDSLSWRNAAVEKAPDGTETRRHISAITPPPNATHTQTAIVEFKNRFVGAPVLRETESILLRVCRVIGIYHDPAEREKTYSAPFATHTHKRTDQGYEPLKHWPHVFGTNESGQDVLFLALRGIRTGLIIGFVTTLIAVPFALIFGVLAGYFGGWVDDIITYIYSLLGNIPNVLLIAAVILLFGQGLFQLCVIMGLTSWVGLCRLLRGETYKLREMEYVQAAEAFGVPRWRIMARHLMPNVMHIVLISSILRFSDLVLAEAVLTYLGIGVGPNTGSWGTMINQATSELARDPIVWWTLAAAFIFMLVLVLAANIFGDAVRDALDPRLRTR